MFGRLRPVPGRPPPPPPPTDAVEPPKAVDRVEEPLKLEESVESEAVVSDEPLRLEEEPDEPDEPEEAEKVEPEEETEEVPKQEPKGRMSWMLSRSYPPPPPHAQTRPGKTADLWFPIGDHMVAEEDGTLLCRKCRRRVPLQEADRLTEVACRPPESPASTVTEAEAPQAPQTSPATEATNLCPACRSRAGTEAVPMLDPLTPTPTISKKVLCTACYRDYLRILRYAGPRLGRGPKAKAPPNGVWFSYGENNSILFTQMGGVWPCPSCEEFFENLYDLAVHFVQKHPDIANGLNKVTVNDGKPVALKTPQGYLVCPCGFLAENEKHLAYHIRHHRNQDG